MLTGAVMVGGRSRRMGRDKATLVVAGETLLQRQVRVLREAGAQRVLVVRRAGQAVDTPAGTELIEDTIAEAGPLAGLHAALNACHTPLLAVLAVDMPGIDPGWFHWLGSHCGDNIGATARRPDDKYEPLASIYPRAALREVTQYLFGPDRSLQALVDALVQRHLLRSVSLPPLELHRVKNWNCPDDAASGPG